MAPCQPLMKHSLCIPRPQELKHLAGLGLQELLRETNSNDARGAAHASQIVGRDVTTHLEVIDQHGRK